MLPQGVSGERIRRGRDSAFKGDTRILTHGLERLLTHACVIVPIVLPRRILLGKGARARASAARGPDVKEGREECGVAIIMIQHGGQRLRFLRNGQRDGLIIHDVNPIGSASRLLRSAGHREVEPVDWMHRVNPPAISVEKEAMPVVPTGCGDHPYPSARSGVRDKESRGRALSAKEDVDSGSTVERNP